MHLIAFQRIVLNDIVEQKFEVNIQEQHLTVNKVLKKFLFISHKSITRRHSKRMSSLNKNDILLFSRSNQNYTNELPLVDISTPQVLLKCCHISRMDSCS